MTDIPAPAGAGAPDEKAVLEHPSQILCACGHKAHEHGAMCFQCVCDLAIDDVIRFGYRAALAAAIEEKERREAEIVQAFVVRVNARAEAEIEKTHQIEGAHHRALEAEVAVLAQSIHPDWRREYVRAQENFEAERKINEALRAELAALAQQKPG